MATRSSGWQPSVFKTWAALLARLFSVAKSSERLPRTIAGLPGIVSAWLATKSTLATAPS
jgi:hypothetical protein